MDKKISEYLTKIGTKGGETTAEKYSKEHWQELQKKSVEARKKKKK